MAKPIFLIKYPHEWDRDSMKRNAEFVKQKLHDWHVLFISSPILEDTECTMYNSEEAQEIDIEEIKQMIRDSSNL